MSLLAIRVEPDRVELVTDTIAYGGDAGAVRFKADSPKRTPISRCRSVMADVGKVILANTWQRWAELVDETLTDLGVVADVDALAAAAQRDHAEIYAAAQQRCDELAPGAPRILQQGGRIFAGWSEALGGYRAYLQYNDPGMLTFEQMNRTTWAQPIPDGFTAEPPSGRDAWFDWVLDLRDAIIAAYPTDPEMVLIGGDVTYTLLQDGELHEEHLVAFGDAEDEFALLRHLDRLRAEHLRARDAYLDVVGADSTKVGRNDPCPCGSGRKHKHCHLAATV